MPTIASMLEALSDDPGQGLLAGDRVWSWAEVCQEGRRRARYLDAALPDDPPHIALLLGNVPEYVFWIAAAAFRGAVVVGVNPTHRGADLARDISHTECGLLVTDGEHLELLDGLDLGERITRSGGPGGRIVVTDSASFESDIASVSAARIRPVATEGSLAFLVFTSGTSGAPKACRCTQGRLAGIAAVVATMFELGRSDVCYLAMPLFHSNALMAGLGPAIASGAAIALPSGGRFSASGFLPDVRQYGATYFNYVGKPLTYILATPERPDDADNTLIRVFGNEGSPADVERFARRFGCRVVDSYGSTEGGAVVQRTPDTPPGALGRAPEGTIVVDPETLKECPRALFDSRGQLLNAREATGELVSTTSASGFEGYWKNDEAEKERLRNGWYWTGDLAYRDEEGFFYFAGRSDDWLRVDGENFAAAPLARILERHPDVRLASVYAVPDPTVGDQVMAALELHEGAHFDPEDFAAFLAAQPDMGTKWYPRYLRIASSLPVTATSKILTRVLREQGTCSDDPIWWRPGKEISFVPHEQGAPARSPSTSG